MPQWFGKDTDWNDVRRIATGIDVRKRVGAGHDPVTLTDEAEVVLDIGAGDTPQEIDLDTQAANTVFAGPTAGADAAPTFRALVGDDLGSLLPQPAAQGDMLLADATPEWAILTLGGAAGYALVTTATTAAWDQTPAWSGAHTHQANVILDDGNGDSPSLQFVGGTNDDTIEIFLDDSVGANNSDLTVKLCAADADSKFQIADSGDAVVAYIDADGNVGVVDDAWIGFSSTAGRIEFDSTPAPDVIKISTADFGVACSPAAARMEIEDGGTSHTVLLKITQDDANTYGLVIGNDTWDETDTNGLGLAVRDNGTAYIWIKGSAAEHLILQPGGFASDTGNVGIGLTDATLPNARLSIINQAATGQEALRLDQQDTDDEFIHFMGDSSDGDLTLSIVEEGDQASSAIAGWLKILVTDRGDQVTDQAYYIPFYTLSA